MENDPIIFEYPMEALCNGNNPIPTYQEAELQRIADLAEEFFGTERLPLQSTVDPEQNRLEAMKTAIGLIKVVRK